MSTMTAKRTLSFLKGDAMLLKAERIETLRSSGDTESVDTRLEANEYAQAAVFADLAGGKSSLKRAVKVGFKPIHNS